MNAQLIHLGSIECFQHAQAAGVGPTAFLVLQALAAEDTTAEVYPATLVARTGLSLCTVYDVLHKLEQRGLVAAFNFARRGGKTGGRPAYLISLTPQGRSLMTPVALREATPATSNPWRHSQL